MIDYKNSKIYLIKNNTNNLVYVGATTEIYLSTRFQKHKSQKCSICNYINDPINNTNWNDWYIELYENYACNDKNELNKKEGDIQRLFKNDNNYILINKKITNKQKEETNKEWIEKNKERYLEKRKEYRNKNKEIITEKMKEWHKNNKEFLKKKNSEIITCECGCLITNNSLTRHKKTNKHLKLMNSLALQTDIVNISAV